METAAAGYRFVGALPGYLAPDPISQARTPLLQERMASLSRVQTA